MTEITSRQIRDDGVYRSDLNVNSTGNAVIRKIIAGTNITIGSTGVDSGTGDVTINSSGGSSSNTVTAQTTNYTILTTDYAVLMDATASNRNATLYTAVGHSGSIAVVKKTDSTTNFVDIITTSSQTIDGALIYRLVNQNESVILISDGSNWHVIGVHTA